MAEEAAPVGLTLSSLVQGLQAPPTSVTPPETQEQKSDTPTDKPEDKDVVDTADKTPVDKADDSVDKPEDKSDKTLTQLLKSDYLPDVDTEFPETFEGVSSFVKEVAEAHTLKGRESMMDELFTNLPELEDYLEFRLNGGTPEAYYKTLSEASTEELDLASVDNQKKAMRLALGDKMEKGDLDTLLDTLEETGKLKESAEKYYGKIKETNSTKAQQLIEQQAKQAEEQRKANEAHWTSLKKIVDTGNLGTAVIPSTERKAFYDWMAVPDKDGKVGQQKTWEAMTPEQKLAAQYFIFKKGDVGSLAARSQGTKKVDAVIAALKPGSRLASDKSNTSVATKIALNGISGTTFQ